MNLSKLCLSAEERGQRYDVPMRSSTVDKVLLVRRRCLVCEQEFELEEAEGTDEIGTPCVSCSAPSERTGVLRSRTRPAPSNPHAAALGRLGGLRGGPARAQRLSPERRREIARRAARKRWAIED